MIEKIVDSRHSVSIRRRPYWYGSFFVHSILLSQKRILKDSPVRTYVGKDQYKKNSFKNMAPGPQYCELLNFCSETLVRYGTILTTLN